MTQLPRPEILERQQYEEIISKHYSPIIALIDEVANYGSCLCAKSFERSEHKLSDAVILAVMLKHTITMLDSLSILLSKSAVTASHVIARTLFENAVYLRWVLKENTIFRASAFYYWDIRSQLAWARAASDGTAESQKLSSDFADTDGLKKPEIDQEKVARSIELLEKKLTAPELADAHARFEEKKRMKYRLKDWYTLDGPENLREVFKAVGWNAYYRVFYSQFSQSTHGGSIGRHMNFKGQELLFEPVRNPDGWDQVVRIGLTLSFKTYRSVIAHYCPDEEKVFSAIYKTEWRERFLKIGSVESKDGNYVFNF